MIKGLILTGGKSRRLGQDKFRMEIHKREQFVYLHELLTSMEIPTYISCNDAQMSEIPDSYFKLADQYKEAGPLGGITTAFDTDPLSAWLVIACDLPFVTEKVIRQLMENRSQKTDAVTFRKPGNEFLETTLTIYEPSVFGRLRQAIQDKVYKLQEVLKTLRVRELIPDHDQILFNVNTPEELAAARYLSAQKA